MNEWEGVLPLWKEAGMTSHDCVARARKILKQKRIGHTGTLDPDVSGVLPLCLGRATRIVEYLQELPKTYEAELTIGYATDTEDASGDITESSESVAVTEREIREAVVSFVGTIEQIPPMYSALKIQGKRLYELAREGQTVERAAREVTIYGIDIRSVNLDSRYPKVSFEVTCSKGTYIRTLCVDIGRKLGYPAVMSALERTGSGAIRKADCITLLEAEQYAAEGTLAEHLVSVADALSHLPGGIVNDTAVLYALQGRKLFFPAVALEGEAADGQLVRLFGRQKPLDEHQFIGIYRRDETQRCYIPEKLFT
ncbi:tRNA pseudouridine(55) synthase TruB [Paenibacillus thermotolerans]|uniref:tRNA pseudouridine(55) synthase TruB n=1 Tax=Paenibacillus thermotolerans TaxID=3027807 RepID=UPI0023686424|nr:MULTISPECIES: tRNA pseudouridine(55) synthase TruB [unclassified Paenibacillus]